MRGGAALRDLPTERQEDVCVFGAESYRRPKAPVSPKLTPLVPTIDLILVHRKQRHTATRILERQWEERGFTGGS